jgi:uncharacterized membrane protein
VARNAAEDATMTDDEERDDEEVERDDDDERDEEESSGNGRGDEGLLQNLMSQLGEHKSVLAPVATSAAAAAATYAAKKLPDLIERVESGGGDKIREKLGDAKDAGGAKGLVAGAASRAFSRGGGGGLVERLKQGGEEEAKDKAKESGGVTGAMAKVADKVGGNSQGGHGWGRGRRLPLMYSIDVAAPIRTVYDQWTQFEEMNSFMHRVESVDQEEDEVLTWHVNVWGRRRTWKAQITEQVPNQRIAWELKGGGQGSGVITFHELAPNLTRVDVVYDWQPRGLVEKTASGFRIHKRAARSDLKRFKAFVQTRGEASGGWRGKIDDGKAQGQTRNKRNRDADPIPADAKAHDDADERKAREKGGDVEGEGNGDEAREERKRHREERAKQRKEAA